jgi:hypothetical protein
MPTDFGDIAAYHREEAARHYALAKAARDRECFGEAEYEASLAARWDEAAREQKAAMRQGPIRHIAYRSSNFQPPVSPMPRRTSFATGFRLFVQRIGHAIRQFLTGRTGSFEGLSLR